MDYSKLNKAELIALLEESENAGALAEAQSQVEELNDRLAAVEATKGDDRPVVKVGKKQYLVVSRRARLQDGTVVTSDQIVNDKELQANLVETKSSLLMEIKPKTEKDEK